ncbi:WAT1-related protein At3g30340-like isoform X2 [Andrographis paniculata]|uniref:WAT1-related protein At3g30340-like isoform X2 n=1 Tax=Andrographis paniculata TaxID=175694 RepID=UPI0021E7B001|nr:WAT1-related protein At3g30340-like isoform X2 [Andrographis paniculata]
MKSFVAKWWPVIMMIAISLAFAINNVLLKKIVDDGIDHLVFVTYRQCISAVFLSPLALFIERRSRPKLMPSVLCYLFVSALIGGSVSQYLFLLGIEYTSATLTCTFLNIVPVLTFLMALPLGLESLNIRCSSGKAKLLGAVICLGSTVLLTLYKGAPLIHFSNDARPVSHAKANARAWVMGSMALIAGTFCWSSWFLIQTKIGRQYPCQYSSTAIMACFSSIQSAALSLSFNRKLSVWILKTRSDIFIILYAGIVGSGLCFVGMSWCVKKRGPVFTSAFSPLVQIMAACLDVPLLHEQLHLGSHRRAVHSSVGQEQGNAEPGNEVDPARN